MALSSNLAVDAIWPDEATADDNGMSFARFAAEVAQTLMRQDYCLVRIPLADDLKSAAAEEACKLDFGSVKKELRTAYLGRKAESKSTWMHRESTGVSAEPS